MDIQKEIPVLAKDWLKTPFKRNCCCKGKGVDCARFVIGVFKEAGIVSPGYYPPVEEANWTWKDGNEELFIKEIEKFADKVEYDDRKAGDIVSFKGNGKESHLAILIDDRTIIHAVRGQGVLMHLLKSFMNKFYAVYRVRI